MKRFLLLPILAIGLMVSQSWGAWTSCANDLGGIAYFCEWPTGCYEINKGETDSNNCLTEFDGCKTNGYLYTGVTATGAGVKCSSAGGTWAGVGNNPNFNGGVAIWCQWATGCEAIKTEEDFDNCKINGSVYKNVAAADVGATKKCGNSGTWTGEGKDPNAVIIGCCNWEGNGCFQVTSETEWADCAAGYRYATCPGDEAGTCVGSPIGGGGEPPVNPDPITISGRSVGLTIVPNGNVLHIISDKAATVELFSMTGAKVFSSKVAAGNSSLSLGNQKTGVYYAVVKSGSQKQTVKVILK